MDSSKWIRVTPGADDRNGIVVAQQVAPGLLALRSGCWQQHGELCVPLTTTHVIDIGLLPRAKALIEVARLARDYLYCREGNDAAQEQGLVTCINVALDDLGVPR